MDVIAKKSLGQHFLKDEGVLNALIEIAGIQSSDRVFEIGPGTGQLTKKLAEVGAKVLALELDRQLVDRLNQHFIESDTVSILEGNILDVHLQEVLEHAGYGFQEYKIVANIPYYITAPIVRTLLSLPNQAYSITLMVQNEVADRLVAKPGDMSMLSVMAQYYAQVEKKLFVPKTAFDPIPAVDSAVVYIVPTRRFDDTEDRRVFRIVRAGFSARRKTLANNLANAFHIKRSVIEQVFQSLGISPLIRGQELSVPEWRALADLMEKEIGR